MQETLEEKDLHLEKTKAKRMEETPEEKEVCLKNNRERAKAKRLEETQQEKLTSISLLF